MTATEGTGKKIMDKHNKHHKNKAQATKKSQAPQQAGASLEVPEAPGKEEPKTFAQKSKSSVGKQK